VQALLGVGVSPGRAVGDARIVRELRDLEAVRRGEVIVAAATDPSWTSLLSLGGALVLEVGGMLSHGAIVARALGIPAVAEVARATSLLRTGDRVTVDGGSGRIAVV
jgi:pyruvate,water dikinase